jgi:hypothetical protein
MLIRFRRPVLMIFSFLLCAASSFLLTIQTAKISLNPSSGPPGTYVALNGSGFTPDQTGDIRWDGYSIGSVDIYGDGSAKAGFNVPKDAPGGNHTVSLITKGEEAYADFWVEVTPAETPTPAVPSPVINMFYLEKTSIAAGECTTLHWAVENAVNVLVSGDFGTQEVESAGEMKVCPPQTTTYQLTAAGAKGSDPDTATAKVVLKVAGAGTGTPTPTRAVSLTPTSTPTLTPTTQMPNLQPQMPGSQRCTSLDLGPGAQVINFDDRLAGDMLTDQFLAQGIRFPSMSAYIASPPMGARSGSLAVQSGYGDLGSYLHPISILFNTPLSAVGVFVGREAPTDTSRALFAVLTAYDYREGGGSVVIGRSRVQLPNEASPFQYCLVVQAPSGSLIRSATLEYSSATGVSSSERRWMDDLTVVPASIPVRDNPPQVTIITPSNGARVTANGVGFRAQIREDIGLRDVSISVNGKPLNPIGARQAGGGDPTLYETNLNIGNLDVDADNTIRVVATDSAGQTGEAVTTFHYQPPNDADIWITGYEVTQSIQTTQNSIPLVGNKVTIVRVYVQSREGLRGQPWTDVSATLTVGGRTYLPANTNLTLMRVGGGSAHPAMAVSPSGSSRTDLESGFYFVLDCTDTAPGARTFQANIFSVSGRAETDAANNTVDIPAHFNRPLTITIYATPFGINQPYYSGTTGEWVNIWGLEPRPWSHFEGHRIVAENMLPVSRFIILPIPGIGTSLPAQPMPQIGPVLPPAFDSLEQAREWAHRIAPGISSTAIIYLLEPEGRCACGLAGERDGNVVINGQDNRRPEEIGLVMAHETSHAFGLWWHVIAPDHDAEPPANNDYPYPEATIGPQVGIQTTTHPPVLKFGHMHDIMSYAWPAWISPYTYCAVMSGVGGPSCDAATRMAMDLGTPAGGRFDGLADLLLPEERPFLYISGWIHLDGSAEFEPVDTILSKENLESTGQAGDYVVVLEDSAGRTLGTYGFDIGHTDGEPLDRYLFSVIAPDVPQVVRITLRQNDAVLAERTRSANKPEVYVATPAGGEEWSGMQTIYWKAGDADGEALTYSVEYSPDGGGKWLPLGVGLTGDSLEVNFDALPGSDRALIRVTASDGMNSGWDQTDGTFRVPRKGPEVTLSSPADGAVYAEGEPILAQASAFDWEDGAPADDAFAWTDDRAGNLGMGSWISVQDLSAGAHVLTVTVRDRDGNQSSASVHVTVQGRAVQEIAAAVNPPGKPTWGLIVVLFVLGGLLMLFAAGFVFWRVVKSRK